MGKRCLPPFNWGHTEFIDCSVLRVDYQSDACASLLGVCANRMSLSSTMDRNDIEKKSTYSYFSIRSTTSETFKDLASSWLF